MTPERTALPSVQTLARATRARTLPVMLMPVVVGAAFAYDARFYQPPLEYAPVPLLERPFEWGWFFLTLAAAAVLHLAANVLNDYFDDRSGVDRLARIDRSAIPTASGVIESGRMTARAMLRLAVALFAGAAVMGVVIAAGRGWMVLVLGAIGAALAIEYVGPPLRLAYRGRGLGEVAIFCAYGVLPVVGAYFVQTRALSSRAVWASVVPGLLTTLVLYHQNFLHWRADKAAGKRTPVVALGPEFAIGVSGVLIVLAYAVLAIQVALRVFPPLALVAILTALPLGASWARATRDPAPQRYLNLLGATIGAAALTGVVLVIALVVG